MIAFPNWDDFKNFLNGAALNELVDTSNGHWA